MRHLGILSLLSLAAGPLAAQAGSSTSAFITRLGRDTVMLERLTRFPDRIEGELFLVSPRTRRIHYSGTLDASGYIAHFEVSSTPAVATPPSVTITAKADLRDTLLTLLRTSTTAKDTRIDTLKMRIHPGATPFLGLSTGLLEQMTLQAQRAGGDSVAIEIFTIQGQRQAVPNYVARRGRDSVAIDYFGTPFYLRVDPAGRVLGLSGARTTQKFLVQRVAKLNLEQLEQGFIARERAGQVVGLLSPRDTVGVRIGGGTIWFDYGRPSKRGRVIFGGIVPWNEVWRTGANQATQLTTTVDLMVGSTLIPTGKYSVWTLPTAKGVQLILNRQSGQWGTEHDPKQDVVKLGLRTEQLAQPVEQFTITVVDLGRAGEIRFDWDKTRWILPFTIR